ncbi:CapA family protein [Candidatus Saccharibacteria bacterium]|nr:CapA family protein [Candidatus Saccharibacteria bacterium]
MRNRKRGKVKYFLAGGVGLVLVAIGVFFLVQFVTKTGVFRIPGVVYYDESLTSEEVANLKTVFGSEIDLYKDLTIKARNVLRKPEPVNNEFVTNIAVPVTDFYSVETDISVERADELFNNCEDCWYKMINLSDLSFDKKLLSINGEYYLNTFKSGAVFRVISFESELYEKEVATLAEKWYKKTIYPEESDTLTLVQTGVTAFSRLMNAKMNEVGTGEYFAAGLKDFMSQYDIIHTSSEASFSDWAPTSGATGTPICADKRFMTTLTTLGLDIVELTGNHNQDCGDEAATESIEMYESAGIKIVGGGRTATEAAIPLNIEEKHNNVTMLAYNESTGGATYDNTPGANQYYEEQAAADIATAKARGDFVIVDVQYYECSMYVSDTEDGTCDAADSAAGDQVGFFRHLIDLGADVVVGTSAHQPQTFELYGTGVIFYGLGNIFFDQYRWPGTTRSLMLVHHIYNNRLLQVQVAPTVYDNNFQTRLTDEDTTKWFLKRLIDTRP